MSMIRYIAYLSRAFHYHKSGHKNNENTLGYFVLAKYLLNMRVD